MATSRGWQGVAMPLQVPGHLELAKNNFGAHQGAHQGALHSAQQCAQQGAQQGAQMVLGLSSWPKTI